MFIPNCYQPSPHLPYAVSLIQLVTALEWLASTRLHTSFVIYVRLVRVEAKANRPLSDLNIYIDRPGRLANMPVDDSKLFRTWEKASG